MKNYKSQGFDELHVSVIKPEFNEIKSRLIHVFRNPLDKGSSTEKMIIAKVTPIFKAGKKELVTNYKSIPVLSSLSKMLERIMYNRLHLQFDQNKSLYRKQFEFTAHYSTDHAYALVSSIL